MSRPRTLAELREEYPGDDYGSPPDDTDDDTNTDTETMPLQILTFPAYCALPGVNWSMLGKMRASPLHYLDATTRQRDPTPEQSTGSAVHTLVLEPGEFNARYAVYDGDGTRASKEYKLFAASVAEGVGILKRCDMDEIQAMADAVDQHPTAGPLFTSGWAESSFIWTDPATGIECKGRTDWLLQTEDGYWLVDLKTGRTADPRAFGRSAGQYGYHNQLAHYRAGLEANGITVTRVLIVVVESSAPYDVVVYEVVDTQLDKAALENAALLARVAECRASGQWPGRYPDVTPLDLPAWIMGSDDIEVGEPALWGAT